MHPANWINDGVIYGQMRCMTGYSTSHVDDKVIIHCFYSHFSISSSFVELKSKVHKFINEMMNEAPKFK